MIYRLLNAKEMRACDTYTSAVCGVPSKQLIKLAAEAAFDEIRARKLDTSRVYIVCGSGNNGADGFALASLLASECGSAVTAIFAGDDNKMTEECKAYHSIASEKVDIAHTASFDGATLIVDALFGIGLARNISDEYADIINKMNEIECQKISLDIPSGINATTGEVMGTAFKADITITFSFLKLGQIFHTGSEYCGEIVVRDVGISDDAIADETYIFTSLKTRPFPPPRRRPDSNKGDFGKVLVIGGAAGMAGAIYFSALAAYKCGAGLVKIFTSEENRTALTVLLPEAVLITYGESNQENGDNDEMIKKLTYALSDATVVVVGPGLSQSENAKKILSTVISNCDKPLILDADALNILSSAPSLLNSRKSADLIITPHMGEMSRLTGKQITDLKKNRLAEAFDFSRKHGLICVLKDARTVVADSRESKCYLNMSGTSAMSKGGSGDALTGAIAALTASGMPAFQAACLGVYLHGEAGEKAAEAHGDYSVLARDIASFLHP